MSENIENKIDMENETDIEYKVVELLIEKGLHISFAESCTAGLAAARLVNVPDASKVLDVSFVTYANEAKMKYVGVSAESIEEYGVVSEEVAGQMARGVAATRPLLFTDTAESVTETNTADALLKEVGVGISGIAGPTGGTAEKPVGMVCFGFYIRGEVKTFTQYFGNIGRNNVRAKSVQFVYETLLTLL